jgi:hypothetical protein
VVRAAHPADEHDHGDDDGQQQLLAVAQHETRLHRGLGGDLAAERRRAGPGREVQPTSPVELASPVEPASSVELVETTTPRRTLVVAEGLVGRPRHLAGMSWYEQVSRKVRAPQGRAVGNTHPE